VVVGDSDDEDDEMEDNFQADLERALKESAKETQSASTSTAPAGQVANGTRGEEAPESSANDEQAQKATLASDFLRQRAELERERLARSKVIVTKPSTASSVSAGKKRSYSESQSDGSEEDQPEAKRNPSPSKAATGKTTATSSSVNSTDEGVEIFYNHELRPTANRFSEKRDIEKKRKTFRISEITGKKENVSFAILSSYCTDPEWLSGLFAPGVRLSLRPCGISDVFKITLDPCH